MKEKSIVKAEILWSRSCPLNCSYCSMADGRRNLVPLEYWTKGFSQLKKLGCSFAAFYGAEPLADFNKLPEIIHYAESIGINTTVITSGVTSYLNDKLRMLYECGLRSITTSYDAASQDSSSKRKSSNALSIIDTFRSFGPVRDVAVVVTLTRMNYLALPMIIKTMSSKGIWTFFDIIHPDRGQPGSKVKTPDDPSSLDLFFDKEDFMGLGEVLKEVAVLKQQGALCHASVPFMETLKIASAYMQTIPYTLMAPYSLWRCVDDLCEGVFPSWVTVDIDGTVYPCDDFQPKIIPEVKVWQIFTKWERWVRKWKPIVKEKCPGCLWNTHIDACLIKNGNLPIGDYIHGLNSEKEECGGNEGFKREHSGSN